jgi:hypothetical protein
MKCTKCGIEKEIHEFGNVSVRGKVYKRKDCKECHRPNKNIYHKKKLLDKPTGYITPEIYEFLREIKRKCYYVDMVDAYKLVSYYTDVFGYEEFDNVEYELTQSFIRLSKCKVREFEKEE